MVAQGQLASGVDQTPDNHRQQAIDPGLTTRIQCLGQTELFDEGQDRVTGPLFSAVENFEGFRIIPGDDLLAERALKEFELWQGTAGDAPVLGMVHFAVFAKRGAQNPDRTFPGGLNFKVQIAMRRLHG